MDFFTVPTATFRVLFVLVVLAHHRRGVIHFNVTEHPTAGWTAQQMVEAFPEDSAPRYLVRDRDKIYGEDFHKQVQGMGITEVKIAPQSPWQSPFVERLVGSVRRECLDHVIVLGEQHLTQDVNKLLRLLSAVQHPLVPEQRCSHFPVGFTGQVQEKSWSSPGRRCPPSVRTARCLTKAPPQRANSSCA